MLNYQAEFK